MVSTIIRKITFGELFSQTVKVFKINYKAIIMVHLIVYIPFYIAYFFLGNLRNIGAFQIWIDIVQFFIALFTGIASLATVYIVDNTIHERPPIRLRQSVNLAYKKWGISITSGFLLYIITILLTMLLIIPGIIWMIYYIFFYQVIALTNLSGKKALDYSKYIVKGHWWKVFGNFFGLSTIPLLIYYGGLYRLYNYLIKIDPEYNIFNILSNTILVLLLSFTNVGMTILYRNMESMDSDDRSNISFYERVNRMVNGDGSDDFHNEDDETYNELYEDDNALRCSICGIRADEGQLICPVCHSVIRRDFQCKIDSPASGSEKMKEGADGSGAFDGGTKKKI